jgi:hypothetical protein
VIRGAALAVALLLFAPVAQAEDTRPAVTTAAPVSITGVKTPASLSLDALKKLPAITVTVSQQTDRGPMTARFTGALVWTILDSAGWVNGPEKNSYLRHTIFVIGKDGYTAALSEGEIDPKLEGKQIILATEKDGAPLDAPRLVVPGDAHASRSVHDVVSIEVH